jgi:hypothetical protein
MIVKNTYGTSVAFSESSIIPKEEFTGSSLQRKKQEPKPTEKETKATD